MSEGQVVVTGASRGIGAAIAADLARRGVSVVCLSRSGSAPAGRGIACDVTDEAQVKATFAKIATSGPIGGLVNNAGIHTRGAIATLEAATFEAQMRANATSVLTTSREAYPHLKEGGGIIVNIGSLFDRLGVVDNLAYCASKAAVAAMTRCMAVEWARDGIAVINVAPGYVATDLNADFLASDKAQAWVTRRIPVRRTGEAHEIARVVGMLIVERTGFLTGETIYLDGGQGIAH